MEHSLQVPWPPVPTISRPWEDPGTHETDASTTSPEMRRPVVDTRTPRRTCAGIEMVEHGRQSCAAGDGRRDVIKEILLPKKGCHRLEVYHSSRPRPFQALPASRADARLVRSRPASARWWANGAGKSRSSRSYGGGTAMRGAASRSRVRQRRRPRRSLDRGDLPASLPFPDLTVAENIASLEAGSVWRRITGGAGRQWTCPSGRRGADPIASSTR